MLSRRQKVAVVLAVALLGGALVMRRRGQGDEPTAANTVAHAAGHDGPRLALANETGRHIAGRVFLEDKPAEGARVRLVPVPVGIERSVSTDRDGRFDLGTRSLDSFNVVAEMPDTTAAMIGVHDPDGDAEHLELVLHECAASIHGFVRDATNAVIAKASVWIDQPGPGARVETDDQGAYDLCVPFGVVSLQVEAAGYARITTRTSVYGRVRHDFALQPEAIVTGRVIRADNRQSVAGAMVELDSNDDWAIERPYSLAAITDTDGLFHIDGVAQGYYRLSAKAPGLGSQASISVTAEIGKLNEVVCALVPTRTISGRVVAGGEPVPGARVLFHTRAADSTDWAMSRADGSFVVEHVRPDDYESFVEPFQQKAKAKITVADHDVDHVVIEVERFASVSGKITRAGQPVEGADVTTRDGNAVSDREGNYTLRGLQPGPHQIYAESKRLGAFTPGPTVSLAQGEQKLGVDIELDLAGSISGKVVDQDDAPVSGAIVNFSLVGGQDGGIATTAEDGTFAARGLSGGGDYTCVVQSRDNSSSLRPAEGKRFQPIAVHDGQTHVTDVRIRVRIDQLTIAGHALDAVGTPLAYASVSATVKGRAPYGSSTATTDVAGAFVLRDLRPGKYSVVANDIHGSVSAEGVAAGRSDLVLRLAARGAIEGVLIGFTELPKVSAYGGARVWFASVEGSAFSLRDLDPGTYYVFARSKNGTGQTRVDVVAGQTAKATITGRGIGSVQVIVLDESQRPVEGLMCDGGGQPATTNSQGEAHLDGVPEGDAKIECFGASQADSTIHVVGGQTTRIEMIAHAVKPRPHGHAGMTLEFGVDGVAVLSIESGGPAARAGIAVGDVIEAVDGDSVDWRYGNPLWLIEAPPPGTSVHIGIRRDDQELTLDLTLAAAP
jgi:protocatechuate 3,4-dioxygenase beta subunit